MKKTNKVISLMLTAVLLLGLLSAVAPEVSATPDAVGKYIPVFVNGSMIMNGGITSDLPTRNYRDTEGKMKDTDVDLTALNPDGRVTCASNASQMSEDLVSYNMIRCFGTKNVGDTDVSGTVPGFSCPAPTSGDSGKDSDEKVRKAQIVNYGAETEANNKGDYSLNFGMNASKKNLNKENQTFHYYVKIAENDTLKRAAAGGGLQFYFSGVCISGHEAHSGDDDHCRCEVTVWADSTQVGYGDGTTRTEQHHMGVINTGRQSLGANSTIHIEVKFSELHGGTGDTVGLCEALLLFRDNGSPTLSSYTSSTNAASDGNQLLIKPGVKNPNNPDDYYYTSRDYASDPGKCTYSESRTASRGSTPRTSAP